MTVLRSVFEPMTLTQWLMLLSFGVFLGFSALAFRRLWQEPPKVRNGVLGVIVLALLLRGLWIGVSQPWPLSDFAVYWQYAHQFFDGNPTYTELSRHPGVIVLFTWFFRWFGPSLWSAWAMNLLFSGVMLLLVYLLGQTLFNRTAGFLALGLGSLLPQLISYTALFASETPAVAYFLLVVWVTLESAQESWNLRQGVSAVMRWVLLGILLYGTILLRSSGVIFLGLIPLTLLVFRTLWPQNSPASKTPFILIFQQSAILVLTALVFLSTWVAHQYTIGGSPKLFWGSELWLSCAVQYDRGGRYTDPNQMAFYPKIKSYYEDGTQAGQIKAYQMMGDEALKIIKADPLKYLQYGFVRMKGILWQAQSGIRWSDNRRNHDHVTPERGLTPKQSPLTQWPQRTINKLANTSTIMWQVLLCCSVLGFLTVKTLSFQTQREGYFLVVSFLLFWLVFHYLLAVASERYAFQIIPLVILLAAGGLDWFFRRAFPSFFSQAGRLPSPLRFKDPEL